jgi:hypothetical protein
MARWAALVNLSSSSGVAWILQSFGQRFELLVCAEFVQAINADLDRLGVLDGDAVDVFGVTHVVSVHYSATVSGPERCTRVTQTVSQSADTILPCGSRPSPV